MQAISLQSFSYHLSGVIFSIWTALYRFYIIKQEFTYINNVSLCSYIYLFWLDADFRLKTYFVGFDVSNMLDVPVTLKWQEGGEKKVLRVQTRGSESYDAVLMSSVYPKNIELYAFKTKSGRRVKIFGKDSIVLTPKYEKERYVIMVGSAGTYLKERNHLWDKFSRFSRILAKFAKLNPREKSSENQFAKINPREFI